MNIYLDSYYKIGSSHNVCEDYSLTGTYNKLSYAIVCDGCSACERTDLGARMLAFIAKETLKHYYDIDLLQESYMDTTIDSIRQRIIGKIKKTTELLGVENSVFSSTLLMAVHIKGGISFFLGWGDGYFIEKRASEMYTHKIEFESSAPFYLNYYIDEHNQYESSLKAYNRQSKNKKVVISDYLSYQGSGSKLVNEIYKQPAEYCFFKVLEDTKEPFHMIIGSDGCGTFITGSKKEKNLAPYDIDIHSLRELVNFKTTRGNFSEKAYNKYQAIISMEDANHYDDLSMASIMVGGLIKNGGYYGKNI